jgi:hypothetical protein
MDVATDSCDTCARRRTRQTRQQADADQGERFAMRTAARVRDGRIGRGHRDDLLEQSLDQPASAMAVRCT